MLILDDKLRTNKAQAAAIDEAIRTVQFIRNKCLRRWMDGRGVGDNELPVYCSQLAKEYAFAALLNSQARQTSADRAWLSIACFYKNCREKKPGQKGAPVSSTITAPLSIRRRAGNESQMGSDSPSPMGWASGRCA